MEGDIYTEPTSSQQEWIKTELKSWGVKVIQVLALNIDCSWRGNPRKLQSDRTLKKKRVSFRCSSSLSAEQLHFRLLTSSCISWRLLGTWSSNKPLESQSVLASLPGAGRTRLATLHKIQNSDSGSENLQNCENTYMCTCPCLIKQPNYQTKHKSEDVLTCFRPLPHASDSRWEAFKGPQCIMGC